MYPTLKSENVGVLLDIDPRVLEQMKTARKEGRPLFLIRRATNLPTQPADSGGQE